MTKICIFGDSIIWGARLSFRCGYVNLLRNYLELVSEEYIEIYDLGIDANTSSDLLERFKIEAKARNPKIIFFAIGTNDSCFRNTNKNTFVKIKEFEINIEKLIENAKKYTNKIILIGLCKGDDILTNPLPQSSTEKSYSKENIKKYNNILKKIAKKQNLIFIDIFNKLKDNDFDDGLHPNSIGHKKIFNEIKKNLHKFIEIKNKDSILNIVDENDVIIDKKEYSLLTNSDIYRTSAVWIENSNGEILISKRASLKRKEPERIMTFAKRVEYNQSYQDAIIESLNNKINLKIDKKQLVEIKKIRLKSEINNFFCLWFKLKIDIQIKDFKINKNEISKIEWISKSKLKNLYKEKSHLFVDGFNKYLELLD